MEVARRKGDYAIAGVAAMVTLDAKDQCLDVRLSLCGVGETPIDASAAADGLSGQRLTEASIDEVAAAVQAMIEPAGSVHASADYQRHLAFVLTRRVLRTAYQRVDDGH